MRQPHAPSVAVKPEADQVAPAEGKIAIERLLLGDVTHHVAAPPRRATAHLDGAPGELLEAEENLEQARLP